MSSASNDKAKLKQTPFLKIFGAESVKRMNVVYNRIMWPIIMQLYFAKKLRDDFDGLTLPDFRHALFNTTHTIIYLRELAVMDRPIVGREDSLFNRTKYYLTPYGEQIASTMWKFLCHITKQEQGKSVEEYVNEMRNMMSVDTDLEAVDEEEEMLRKLEEERQKEIERKNKIEEEKARRAGVVQTPEGLKIDLNKVEVK